MSQLNRPIIVRYPTRTGTYYLCDVFRDNLNKYVSMPTVMGISPNNPTKCYIDKEINNLSSFVVIPRSVQVVEKSSLATDRLIMFCILCPPPSPPDTQK